MQFFQHDGVRLAYVDLPPPHGAGEPILLIHGFASNHVVNWVETLWVKSLHHAGRRVIALDNRGHGQSEKLYDPASYDTSLLAADAAALLDHLEIEQADVMGYSMGARITAFMMLQQPHKMRSAILAGLGIRLVDGVGLPPTIAEAMEAPSLDVLTDPMDRMFRAFAEATKSDLRALAACIRGTRQTIQPAELAGIRLPVLICTGTEDPIATDGEGLAALIPGAQSFAIVGRDHNRAVGDRTYKQAVESFLQERT